MKLVNKSEFARLCGVRRQTIHDLIKKGKIKVTHKMIEMELIDCDKYPPSKVIASKRKWLAQRKKRT